MQHETHRVPVTALAFWSKDVILSGEGPLLRAYRLSSKTLLATLPIFQGQAIHGIIVDRRRNVDSALVWGGQSICQIRLCLKADTLEIICGEVQEAGDWILDAAYSRSPDERATRVALVNAHNALAIATVGEDLTMQLVVSGSNCILYCAQVTWLSASQCLIASGTAFGDIIVWTCLLSEDAGRLSATSQTHYTFSAHEGSVFGVQVSPIEGGTSTGAGQRLLASCSDDRTIRLWDISDLSVQSPTLEEDQRQTGFGFKASEDAHAPPLISKTMGHLSRIWHILFLPSKPDDSTGHPCTSSFERSLMSFGEDATNITWSLRLRQDDGRRLGYSLEQVNAQRAHTGKNIWSVAFDGSCQVAAGAADGAISTRSIDQLITQVHHTKLNDMLLGTSGKADSVRSYAFVNESELLATTDQGWTLLLDIHHPREPRLKEISAGASSLRGYSVVARVAGTAFAAGSDGVVYAYNEASQGLAPIVETGRKVAGLFAQQTRDCCGEVDLLVTNMGTSLALLCELRYASESEKLHVKARRELELSQGFVATSFVQIQRGGRDFVVLGSRQGSIAIFDMSKAETNCRVGSILMISSVHGKETVACLSDATDSQDGDIHILSTGRDGTYAAHKIITGNDEAHFETVHQLTLPFGPNVEHVGRSGDGHLWIWGFRGKQFVVYDIDLQQEVMAVECGGAHRTWSFQIGQEGGTFVWTKASRLYYATQAQLPFQTINSGGHGREIKSAAVSPRDSSLIATGAEDTDIKLSRYEDGKFRCLHTLQKHNTGIQHLAWSNDGAYLFSSGGFEEFLIWRICRNVPCISLGVRCESAHPRSGSSDLRIMNFCITEKPDVKGFNITMVYSDSTIRTWQYDRTTNADSGAGWLLLSDGNYLTSCLTQCMHLNRSILTGGTDGHLIIWKPSSHEQMESTMRHKVHQNSILSLTSTGNGNFIFTGGDDNAIGITRITESGDFNTSLIPHAHAAAITALTLLESESAENETEIFLLSASIDQRVKLWRIRLSGTGTEGIEISLVQNSFTAVADVSSIERMDKGKVLICGVGMDVWKIDEL